MKPKGFICQNFSKKNLGGFTLIELLVVIAVIGMLASIVLVSLKGTREKASLAKVEQFDSSVHHALGAYSAGIWMFDESIQGSALDTSGYGNNGTVTGATLTTDRKGQSNKAYSFNGSTNYITMGNPAVLRITGAITLAGWVKINDTANNHQLFGRGQSLSGNGNFGYAVGYYSVTNRIYWDMYSATARSYIHSNTVTITDTNWHFIVATWDGTTGTNGQKLYIDGALANQGTSAISAIGTPSYTFDIGRSSSGAAWTYFTGSIDDVRVYNGALTTAEIQRLYAEGAQRYQVTLVPKSR
jgi:prepilin-type N-terminal cleavage/methylation domain-containing protein